MNPPVPPAAQPLTARDKARLSQDRKTYYVAAVLDKASSARLLAPLPGQVTLPGPDGASLVLTLPVPNRGQCPP
ncbi:MAG: hypothetical protein EKK53_01245 [Burkholderiales bacterium]|nr:MAG: hypothetical protein EKK53_01245 [Burkholderiales bacterium]